MLPQKIIINLKCKNYDWLVESRRGDLGHLLVLHRNSAHQQQKIYPDVKALWEGGCCGLSPGPPHLCVLCASLLRYLLSSHSEDPVALPHTVTPNTHTHTVDQNTATASWLSQNPDFFTTISWGHRQILPERGHPWPLNRPSISPLRCQLTEVWHQAFQRIQTVTKSIRKRWLPYPVHPRSRFLLTISDCHSP